MNKIGNVCITTMRNVHLITVAVEKQQVSLTHTHTCACPEACMCVRACSLAYPAYAIL